MEVFHPVLPSEASSLKSACCHLHLHTDSVHHGQHSNDLVNIETQCSTIVALY